MTMALRNSQQQTYAGYQDVESTITLIMINDNH